MRPARQTLVALETGHRRINRDPVARSEVGYASADCGDLARALVSHCERVFHHLAADASGRVVMHVGTADADAFHFDQHFAFSRRVRHFLLENFQFVRSGEFQCFHLFSFPETYGCRSKIFPGFMMLLGSKARFTLRSISRYASETTVRI